MANKTDRRTVKYLGGAFDGATRRYDDGTELRPSVIINVGKSDLWARYDLKNDGNYHYVATYRTDDLVKVNEE